MVVGGGETLVISVGGRIRVSERASWAMILDYPRYEERKKRRRGISWLCARSPFGLAYTIGVVSTFRYMGFVIEARRGQARSYIAKYE